MTNRTALALLGTLLVSSAAQARNFGIHATGTLSVRGVAERSVRLQPGVAGWYLTLDVPADASTCRAELVDVSPMPGPLLKWVEQVPNFAASTVIPLPPARYIGSHTYHVTLRCGLRELAHGLVHLMAPSDAATLKHFDLERAQPHEDAAEIAIVPKGSL
jgi:hypothetical protein